MKNKLLTFNNISFIHKKVYVNFHRASLLTDSDRRKYRELFAKLISENELPSLPLLHRPKPKPPNQLPISMPTNLNSLIPSSTHNNNEVTSSNQNNVNDNSTSQNNEQSIKNPLPSNNLSMNFNEIIFPGPQLPSLSANNRSVKATLARQVTNVIKRHNGIIPDNATR